MSTQDTHNPPTFPDIYEGELNEERIKAYTKLADDFNISISTVREIFNRGADWYKSILVHTL